MSCLLPLDWPFTAYGKDFLFAHGNLFDDNQRMSRSQKLFSRVSV